MFVRDNLQKLEIASPKSFPKLKFFMMFTGVVVCPYLLMAVGGQNPEVRWIIGLALPFLVITCLFLASLACGLMMFRHKPAVAKGMSIGSYSY
ncbi:MAG: hypothetical protein ACKVZH_16330 [Blastocatellia bacterium]